MKKVLAILLFLLPLALCAQTRKGSGIYTYYADPSMSVKQAMAAAIENAKAQALAKEFGTMLVQSTLSQTEQKNGKDNEFFSQLSTEEVKGEWIEDLKEPEATITATMNDGTLVIEAKVSGKARAISNEAVDFQTLALRNGTEKRFADTNFYDGDDFYLYFNAPTDGYVAAYLVGEDKNAYCLLPYANDENGQQPVKHGKEYIFFSRNHTYDLPRNVVDNVYMTCDDERMEHNTLYVIFSPNPFTKAVDVDKQTDKRLLPRQLSFQEFTKWIGKLGARDKQMNRKIIRLIVKKKQT